MHISSLSRAHILRMFGIVNDWRVGGVEKKEKILGRAREGEGVEFFYGQRQEGDGWTDDTGEMAEGWCLFPS